MKVACQLTGLAPDTMRAWERRYGAVTPKRDEHGRRLYDTDDIARLRLLRDAVDRGHAIRHVGPLTNAEIERLLAEGRDDEPDRVANSLVTRLLEAAENYRPDLCDEILGLAIAGFSPRDAVQKIIAPALVEAGTRWHANRLSVAQEHLLTASVERLVMSTMHTFQKVARGPGIVFATLAGERHAIGSLLAAFLAASQGIRCIYLGADLPAHELAEAAKRSKAAAVALSITTEIPSLKTQLDQLRETLPGAVELWIGGGVAQDLLDSDLPRKCFRFKDFGSFVDRVEIVRERIN
jgi:methanogenic corrinoid protein MtbC1